MKSKNKKNLPLSSISFMQKEKYVKWYKAARLWNQSVLVALPDSPRSIHETSSRSLNKVYIEHYLEVSTMLHNEVSTSTESWRMPENDAPQVCYVALPYKWLSQLDAGGHLTKSTKKTSTRREPIQHSMVTNSPIPESDHPICEWLAILVIGERPC